MYKNSKKRKKRKEKLRKPEINFFLQYRKMISKEVKIILQKRNSEK